MAVLAILAPAFAAGFSVAASPGAVNLMSLRWGLQRGAGVSLAIGMGAATVDTFYMAVSLAGVLPLLAAADWLESVLMFVGGGVLVLLGIASLRSGYVEDVSPSGAVAGATLDRAPYVVGVSVTLVNPSTIAAWLAISGGILASADLGSGGIPEGLGGSDRRRRRLHGQRDVVLHPCRDRRRLAPEGRRGAPADRRRRGRRRAGRPGVVVAGARGCGRRLR